MDARVAHKVLGLIFGVTVKDGKLTDSEIAFMDRACAKLGIPTDRESWSMPIADPDDAAAQLRAMPKQVQQDVIGVLVDAAAVDGVVHVAERRFLETAAKVVGWTTAQLEERIVQALSAVDVP
jgi:uncharacterized tellurite resistance protein B-like protein